MITEKRIEKKAIVQNTTPQTQVIEVDEVFYNMRPFEKVEIREATIKFNKYLIYVKV